MFATAKLSFQDVTKLPVKYSELSPGERREVRVAYIKQQNDKCYYCKGVLTLPAKNYVTDKKIHKSLFPKGFFDHPIHLHHNHDTDMTIGAVHAWCNAVLWEHEGE